MHVLNSSPLREIIFKSCFSEVNPRVCFSFACYFNPHAHLHWTSRLCEIVLMFRVYTIKWIRMRYELLQIVGQSFCTYSWQNPLLKLCRMNACMFEFVIWTLEQIKYAKDGVCRWWSTKKTLANTFYLTHLRA